MNRLKNEIEVLRDEVRTAKKEEQSSTAEVERLTKELEAAYGRLEKLERHDTELSALVEQNNSLQYELSVIQDQYESVLHERDDLETQNKRVIDALNDEREAKNNLELQLQDSILRSPSRVSWLAESVTNLPTDKDFPPSNDVKDRHSPFSAPVSPIEDNQRKPVIPSLLSELQNTFLSSSTADDAQATPTENSMDVKDFESLHHRLQESQDKVRALENQVAELQKEVSSFINLPKEVEKWRFKYQQVVEEKDEEISSFKDELAAKKEVISQLKNKKGVLSKEKASLEIELEGVKEELKRAKENARLELEKLENEMANEQTNHNSLKTKLADLEEKLASSVGSNERLEAILVNSDSEIVSMQEEILNIHKTLSSLQAEKKLTSPTGEYSSKLPELNNKDSDLSKYTLTVKKGERRISINRDGQALEQAIKLRGLLRQVRSPLEFFAKTMLESSLASSSQHILTANTPSSEDDDSSRRISELETTVNKLKAKLSNRTEEVNQLRAIMKARQTTVDVTVSSLKSKLESQTRAHETETNQLKHKLKTLRKERDDQISLGALTSKRCQDYIEEIGKLKRKLEEVRGESDQVRSENKLLNVYLERTIKQKLDISQQLEKYQEEEERTRFIPLTLSSSRV